MHPNSRFRLVCARMCASLVFTVAVFAQRQLDELLPLPTDRDDTRSMVLADFDLDGLLDLIAGNDGQSRYYRNEGHGTFAVVANALPPQTASTRAVVAFDMDGDGDQDLLLAAIGQVYLYENDGSGLFVDVSASHLPGIPGTTAGVAGDVDGDGDIDLVVGNALYLNNGSGVFSDATGTHLPAGFGATALCLGDLDGDADLDLITDDGCYKNLGSGMFVNATQASLPPGYAARVVTLGDVDGDGDLDLATGNGTEVAEQQNRLYRNDGTGRFTDVTAASLPAQAQVTAAVLLVDIDADGDLDLLAANTDLTVWYSAEQGYRNQLFLNDGAGLFSDASAAWLSGEWEITQALAAGDVDGDGSVDVVFGNQPLRHVLSGVTGQGPNHSGVNRLAFHRGGSLQERRSWLPDANEDPGAMAFGDLDGDGDLDLVLGNIPFTNANGQNRFLRNVGNGRFEDETASNMPVDNWATYAVALGDVDGDGDLDLVAANGRMALGQTISLGGPNLLYRNDGAGSFTSHSLLSMGDTRAVVMRDLDADGDLDLVFGNAFSQLGTLLDVQLNDGAGNFAAVPAAQLPQLAAGLGGLELGDVDSDGDLDLVLAAAGQNRLYLNDGLGGFTDVTSARMPSDAGAMAVEVGDLDGDGDLDLVFAGGGVGAAAVYRNSGAGFFVDASAQLLPILAWSTNDVALTDIDVDGDFDLVFANDGQDGLLINDGSGVFSDGTAARMQAADFGSLSLAVGDVDGDGDDDVCFGNLGRNRMYRNLHTQLDAPHALRLGDDYTLRAYSRYGPPALVDVALPYLSTGSAAMVIPGLGLLGVDPAQMVALSPMFLSYPSGVESIRIAIPNVPTLVGQSVYCQALMLPWPFDARLSNTVADTVDP